MAEGRSQPHARQVPDPRGGVIDRLQQLLAAAIGTGEVIRIVYHGGSRPGSVRDVRPLSVTPEALRAQDIASGLDRTFLLEKIEITDAPVTAPGRGPQTIEEAIGPKIPELQALGWHLEQTPAMITVHKSFKIGRKPRKKVHVSIWFEEYTGIIVVGEDGDDADGDPIAREETWKSRAPYHVSSDSLRTRSFANLWKAAALFIDEARTASARLDAERKPQDEEGC
jgi:hypothetical protein